MGEPIPPDAGDGQGVSRLQLAAPTDEALAQAARGGDQTAFRELYRRHAQRVYARLSRLVGLSADREDLTQLVFWKFHEALPRFRGDAPVGAFLHGIVIRVAYEALRRRKRTPTQLARDVDLEPLLVDCIEPEWRAQQGETLERLFAILDCLKPKHRIAFVLHAVEGLPLTEVARLTQTGPRTAGQRVAAARKHIQRLIGRQAVTQAGGAQ